MTTDSAPRSTSEYRGARRLTDDAPRAVREAGPILLRARRSTLAGRASAVPPAPAVSLSSDRNSAAAGLGRKLKFIVLCSSVAPAIRARSLYGSGCQSTAFR